MYFVLRKADKYGEYLSAGTADESSSSRCVNEIEQAKIFKTLNVINGVLQVTPKLPSRGQWLICQVELKLI